MHYRDSIGRTPAPRLVKRDDAGKRPRIISGLAAVFYRADDPGSEYELMRYGNYRVIERLMPTAFDRALRERDDVRALFNHDPSMILGRTAAGTLRLRTDGVGLAYEIDVPDTTVGRDVAVSLQRRDVSGSSFSFDYQDKSVREVTEADGTETAIIEVHSVVLYDVGPVSNPAYGSTTADARSGAPAGSRGAVMLAIARQMEQKCRR